ncbi:hypothetical protein [Alkaliphilus peptidifermentans]|uniref:Uncharacterized protein n=1 Tax=Alkaliphilus peptidifermentans DSM 18978 TaxID=1120976 RepID=A0A1G5JKQ2_9FIRM|nr:hypothetical protein [Alkaliphilus peptidifermentans]SCY88501.1 hypothetical protein SAMN03080606_02876 [Alkaliphilus peptidifermentans DSM 18978]
MAKEKLSNIIPLEKVVKIGGKTFNIKKLPLGQYAKVLLILKKLPGGLLKEFQSLDVNDEEALMATLFGTAAEAWWQVIEIIAIGSGIDKEVIENDPSIGLDGGVELFLAIWEVNNLAAVMKSVKNAMSQSMAQ